MAKKVVGYILYGIAYGCTWLVLVCFVGNLVIGEAFLTQVMGDFTRQVLGSVAVGLGLGTTSIVYRFERLSLWQQVLIHFGVGMSIFFPVAFGLGWIPPLSGVSLVWAILMGVVIFFVIWSGFYLYYRGEAKRMNKRLQEMSDNNEDWSK